MFKFLFIVLHQFKVLLSKSIYSLLATIKLKCYGANVDGKVFAIGLPYIYISRKGNCNIGRNFSVTSSLLSSISGGYVKSRIEVRSGASLDIGQNVGISGVTIFCSDSILIGNNTKIGFGTHIYDTDFHSLNPIIRASSKDSLMAKKQSIKIGKNVFIGTQCLILKGVVIGDNSVIAAGSVVSRDIPANEIWGGNPVAFIKKV